jgi:hypothetical protein
MLKRVNVKAKAAIGKHFNATGVLPTMAEFRDLMGYRSEGSAHYQFQLLVQERFLAKAEDKARTYVPGPLFVSTPGKTGLPPLLLEALPSGDNIAALVVDKNWRYDGEMRLKPGDIAVVRVGVPLPGSLAVFRRGRAYIVRHEKRRGWQSEGMLLTLLRRYRRQEDELL